MNKLYPPILESTVPACYEENGIVKLTIPFSMNRAVGAIQVGGFELKIKTVQSGIFLHTLVTVNPSDYEINETESYVTFYLNNSDKKIKIGQFYKVQMAYIGLEQTKKEYLYTQYLNNNIDLEEFKNQVLAEGIIGYYSSVSTIKYTTKPNIYINNFNIKVLNSHTHEYIGYYDQTNGDNSEKVYSYIFNIYDKSKKNIIFSSGEKLHNSLTDTNSNLSQDSFIIMNDLNYNEIYYVEYKVKTINKLIISSPKYRIIQRETLSPELHAKILLTQNYNNGYIDINLEPEQDHFIKRVVEISNKNNNFSWINNKDNILSEGFTLEQANIILNNKDKIFNDIDFVNNTKTPYFSNGSFVLCRSSEESNYSNWEELKKFNFNNEIPKGFLYRDYLTVQGKKYQYSIQQYNNYGLYSNRIYSHFIVADFEDIFLYDGEKQLKIRYNPKMTKFTNTVLEQKQDTIGSQYPFIFRNGNVNYHEFPISGLISYLSDEEFLFMSKEELKIIDEKHRNQTVHLENQLFDDMSNNITRERIFKTKVLEWLNNGKPKLFRSPTEGNFLVRLMKVSLSPEVKLGRMLHNFSCTAYEIASINNQTLKDLGFINLDTNNYTDVLRFVTINLSNYMPGTILNTVNSVPVTINSFKCEDLFFGDELIIIYEDGTKESIKIGITGNYEIEKSKNIKSITVAPRYQQINIQSENEFKQYSNLLYIKNKNGTFEKIDSNYIYQPSQFYYKCSNPALKGNITFSYYLTQYNNFSNLKNISYPNPLYRQFIGKYDDILKEILFYNNIRDCKKELKDLYYIKAELRPLDKIIREGDNKNDIYYYGLDNESEKLKFSEIQYPIGLRVYEPDKYYENIGDLKMCSKDYQKNHNYYMYGKYVPVSEPIGRILYEPGKYYIKQNDNSYILSQDEFNKHTVYYNKFYDEYNVAQYDIVKYLTGDNKYLFENNKFYRKTENLKYTLSNSFYEEWSLNDNNSSWIKTQSYYYEFINLSPADNQGEYYNAYATIDKKYLYQSGKYYMQVTLTDKATQERTKSYLKCNSGDFNIHNLKSENYPLQNFSVEYDLFNEEVIKYYKLKPILSHYLHQIGTAWEKQHDDTYAFIPVENKKFIDFYHNETYYDEYEPWFEINGNKIYINDTLKFDKNDLQNFGKITSLSSGNGVILEIGYQLKNLDYLVEDNELYQSNKNYVKSFEILDEKYQILLDPNHKDYIDLSQNPSEKQIIIYDRYLNNYWNHNIYNSYKNLITQILNYI